MEGTEQKEMDGYIRVSRTMGRKGAGYISPDVQRESIERWAQYNGVTILAWHVDEDESGGTQNRPGLRAAMARIESHQTGGLANWRVDRFARNVGPAEADLELIKRHGARIAFTDENLDTSGPTGEFLMTLLLAMARLQRERLSQGWATARGRAIERGAFIGMAPVGYRKIKDKNHPKVGGLEPDPATKDIVIEAYRLTAESDDLHAASRYLRSQLTGRWTAFQTRRLLANRVYIGESRHGEELVNAEAHDPLVRVGTWIAAQVDGIRPRMRSLDYPLSGIARCASCGGPLVGQIGHVRKDGIAPRRYRCGKKWNDREECEAPASCMAEGLEEFVIRALRDLVVTRSVDVSNESPRLAELERELEEARSDRMEFATDLSIKRSLGADAYRAGCKARSDEVDRLESAYREESSRRTGHRTLPFPAELDDPVQLNRALKMTIERIDVQRGSGSIDTNRVDVIWVQESVALEEAQAA